MFPTKRSSRTGFGTILAAALLAMPLAAQPGTAEGAPRGRRDDPRPEHSMWSEMNLTEEQKEKLKGLHQAQKEERKVHGQKMMELRKQIREELVKEKPSRSTLNSLAAQTGTEVEAMTSAKIAHLLKVKGILTPEQFGKILTPRKGGDHKGWGMRRPARGGPDRRKGGGIGQEPDIE